MKVEIWQLIDTGSEEVFLRAPTAFQLQISGAKMKAEFEKLIKVFEDLEEAGATVTLTFSTKGGVSVAKLHLESTSTSSSPPPSTSTGTPSLHPAPGKRRRHRGANARARRNQRAAAHQASMAEAGLPPPRPLCHLPSPPPESGRRQVMAMARPNIPSFSTLNVDGSSSPPPPPPTTPPPPPTPPSPRPSSLRPPLCYDNCGYHCEDCGRCDYLCVDHHGCYCIGDKFYQDEFICEVCNLEPCVRGQSFPTW